MVVSVRIRLAETAAVLALLGAVGLALVWMQMGIALRDGPACESRVDSLVLVLNAEMEDFQSATVPETLDLVELLPEARELLSAERREIGALQGLGPVAEYRYALVEHLDGVGAYYDDVAVTVDFVLERPAIVAEAIGAVDAVSASATEGASTDGLVATASVAEGIVADAVERLRGHSAASNAAYRSDGLALQLETLERSLGGLSASIESADHAGVERAAVEIGAVLSCDWTVLFYEADATIMGELDAARTGLRNSRRKIEEARSGLESSRRTAGFLAFSLAISGVLLAGVAWWR